MQSLEEAPAAIRAWFDAEDRGDRGDGLRELLSEQVVMDFGGRKFTGIDDVIGVIAFVMPRGWLGPVERQWLPLEPDGTFAVRAIRAGGGFLEVMVPGAPPQQMAAMDFLFTLDAEGLIDSVGGRAHHVEPEGLGTVLHAGDRPAPFTLPDTEGADVTLAPDISAATVVAFVSNHCPFSLAWHDRLQKVARDYGPRSVRFLFVNANDPAQGPRDGIEHMRARVAAGDFAAPYLHDADQRVARAWGARRTPEIFVLSRDSRIAYHGAPGPDSANDDDDGAWLRNALDRILENSPPHPAETDVVGCTIKWKNEHGRTDGGNKSWLN